MWTQRTNASLQEFVNDTSQDVSQIILNTLNQIDHFHKATWDAFRQLVTTTLQLFLEIEETRAFVNFTIYEEIPAQLQYYKEKLKLTKNQIQQICDEAQHFEVENELKAAKRDSLLKLEKPRKTINELERNLTFWRTAIHKTNNILPDLQNLTKRTISVLMRDIESDLEQLRINFDRTIKDFIKNGSINNLEFQKQFRFWAKVIKNKFNFAHWGMVYTFQRYKNHTTEMKEDIVIGNWMVQESVLSAVKNVQDDIKVMKKLSRLQIYKEKNKRLYIFAITKNIESHFDLWF